MDSIERISITFDSTAAHRGQSLTACTNPPPYLSSGSEHLSVAAEMLTAFSPQIKHAVTQILFWEGRRLWQIPAEL